MSSKLNRTIRLFNRWVTNPLAMTFAGRGHSPYAVVRHVGRRTLLTYATPSSQTRAGRLTDQRRSVLAAFVRFIGAA